MRLTSVVIYGRIDDSQRATDDIMQTNRARFIAIEGTDGSGVSTQSQALERALRREGWEVHLTKEPTDGPAGAMIRLTLAGRLVHQTTAHGSQPFDAYTLALLFAADRMDHLHNDITPKLDAGIIVISDRYYVSSYAYQGLEVDIEWLQKINSYCLKPDVTVFLDVDPTICDKRMQRHRWHVELYEDVRRVEEVRLSYLRAIAYLRTQGENIVVVDGNRPIKAVHQEVARIVQKVLRRKPGLSPQLNFKDMTGEAGKPSV